MYEKFFGLREKPFNLTPDPRYLYLTPGHREALASLLVGIREKRGIVTLMGEVGTGKTTLLQALQADAGEGVQMISVLTPRVTFQEILDTLCERLFIPKDQPGMGGRIRWLSEALHRVHHAGGNVVLVVDEAQDLSAEVLEDLRLLSNIETPQAKLLQIVLSGQVELGPRLAEPALKALNHRISVRARLQSLSLREMTGYINHRLAVAGCARKALFTRDALQILHTFSGGNPRLVNILCENVLTLCYARSQQRVDDGAMAEVVRDQKGGEDLAVRRLPGVQIRLSRGWLGQLDRAVRESGLLAVLLTAVVVLLLVAPLVPAKLTRRDPGPGRFPATPTPVPHAAVSPAPVAPVATPGPTAKVPEPTSVTTVPPAPEPSQTVAAAKPVPSLSATASLALKAAAPSSAPQPAPTDEPTQPKVGSSPTQPQLASSIVIPPQAASPIPKTPSAPAAQEKAAGPLAHAPRVEIRAEEKEDGQQAGRGKSGPVTSSARAAPGMDEKNILAMEVDAMKDQVDGLVEELHKTKAELHKLRRNEKAPAPAPSELRPVPPRLPRVAVSRSEAPDRAAKAGGTSEMDPVGEPAAQEPSQNGTHLMGAHAGRSLDSVDPRPSFQPGEWIYLVAAYRVAPGTPPSVPMDLSFSVRDPSRKPVESLSVTRQLSAQSGTFRASVWKQIPPEAPAGLYSLIAGLRAGSGTVEKKVFLFEVR